MTVRAWKATLLFAVVFLIGLLALFPASLAARWFVPAVPGLTLGPASGTIWNGSLSSVAYRALNLGRADWTVDPLALFTLSLATDVTLDRENAGPLAASIDVSPSGRIDIENLRGSLRLAELERAGLIPANVASGDVILDLAQVSVRDGSLMAAEGRTGLTALQIALLPGVSLGSYEAELQTANEVITATFSDVEAPLRLNGRAELQPDGSYTASGNITPTAETPETLRQGLMFLGQPDQSGRYNFSFEGRL